MREWFDTPQTLSLLLARCSLLIGQRRPRTSETLSYQNYYYSRSHDASFSTASKSLNCTMLVRTVSRASLSSRSYSAGSGLYQCVISHSSQVVRQLRQVQKGSLSVIPCRDCIHFFLFLLQYRAGQTSTVISVSSLYYMSLEANS